MTRRAGENAPLCGRPGRPALLVYSNGSSSVRSERWPEALSDPTTTASLKSTRPRASESQVSASISTTAGGVPLVWRAPSMHCTAAKGGTRISTLLPGALSASTAKKCITPARTSSDAGGTPSASAASSLVRTANSSAAGSGRRRALTSGSVVDANGRKAGTERGQARRSRPLNGADSPSRRGIAPARPRGGGDARDRVPG